LSSNDDTQQLKAFVIQSFTPLYEEAVAFAKNWALVKKAINNKPLISFIDKIVQEDNYPNLSTSYNFADDNLQKNVRIMISNKDENGFQVEIKSIDALYQHWCNYDLIDNESPNAFASYFLGYLYSPFNNDYENNASNHNLSKRFLEDASKKNYIRATNLLLKYNSLREKSVNKSILQIRHLIISNPINALSVFINNHKARGQLTLEDVIDFKNILYYISKDQAEFNTFETNYQLLSSKLENILIPRIRKVAAKRTDGPIILSFLSSAVLNLTIGINNCILNTNHTMFGIGIIQCLNTIPQFIGSVLSVSHISNLVFKTQYKDSLPASYDIKEISIQSRLIALAGVIYNKEVPFTSNDALRYYAHHLSSFILQNYSDKDMGLISVINESTLNQLQYNPLGE